MKRPFSAPVAFVAPGGLIFANAVVRRDLPTDEGVTPLHSVDGQRSRAIRCQP
jgi:hypothetical protein